MHDRRGHGTSPRKGNRNSVHQSITKYEACIWFPHLQVKNINGGIIRKWTLTHEASSFKRLPQSPPATHCQHIQLFATPDICLCGWVPVEGAVFQPPPVTSHRTRQTRLSGLRCSQKRLYENNVK